MKYTATKDLPPALLSLLTDGHAPNPLRYGVTSLIDSPQVRQLRIRHFDDIEIDPLNNLWMLFGRLLHGKLETYAGSQALTEEKLTLQWDNRRTIVGIPDYYDDANGGTIWDYKFTSTYAAKDETKPAYVAQLNVYAFLMQRCGGFPVKNLRLAYIFRDWSAAKAKQDKDYPVKVLTVKVPVWPLATTEAFLEKRMALHIAAETMTDAELAANELCTDDDRWCQPGKVALMKRGGKRAVKLYDTEADASKDLTDGHYLETRPTTYRRCEDFCEAAQFCKQHGKGLTVDEAITLATGGQL